MTMTVHASDETSEAVDARVDAVAAPATPQLRLTGITKTYTSKDGPVLSGIDLTVATGELVSLLGPSGCGKSTLLRLVAGFIEPDAGSIEIDGRDVTRTATYKRGVGIVHQSHALWPHLTVAENVSFGLEMRKVGRAERARRVADMLELVGLGDFERRLPPQLSGGQQQRVALARALVIEPRLLLLDEPLSSLDANLRVYLREEIRRLQRELGVTTLFVTHDREEAMAVSDRIVILHGGEIAQEGTATELYHQPGSRFVMGFTGATVTFPATVVATGDDQVGLSSALGSLMLETNGSELRAGDEVELCARPDDLRLADPHRLDDARPRVRGRLVDAAFLGTSTQARVVLDDDRQVEIRLGSRQIDDLPPPGSAIDLVIDPAHLRVFAA